ncbi:MAG: hypothetical protein V8R07_08785 [Bacteroides fragilis]
MFLKMYTGLSSPKLMEHLNGNVPISSSGDVKPITAAGDTGKSLETVHEGPGHDVYGCDLLRERDALSYGSEAPVGRIEKSYEICALECQLGTVRGRSTYT